MKAVPASRSPRQTTWEHKFANPPRTRQRRIASPWQHQPSKKQIAATRSAVLFFIPGEEREEFDLLLADLHNGYQPATPTEQILLEKMAQNQWLSLRACRLQAMFLSGTMDTGRIPKDFALLIRYHQSSDRGFLKARTELLKAQKERQNSEIGFESQQQSERAETPQPPLPDSAQDELNAMSDEEYFRTLEAMLHMAARATPDSAEANSESR